MFGPRLGNSYPKWLRLCRTWWADWLIALYTCFCVCLRSRIDRYWDFDKLLKLGDHFSPQFMVAACAVNVFHVPSNISHRILTDVALFVGAAFAAWFGSQKMKARHISKHNLLWFYIPAHLFLNFFKTLAFVICRMLWDGGEGIVLNCICPKYGHPCYQIGHHGTYVNSFRSK